MDSLASRRLLLALSIWRISGLRSDERLAVWDLVDDELSLSVLLRRDLEAAIGRRLEGGSRLPRSATESAAADAELLEARGCRFLPFDDPEYPAALRESARPPFGLFARGPAFGAAFGPAEGAGGSAGQAAVAVVGTRMATGLGLDAAYDIARDLAGAGVMVVSGLARGIDAAAHRGALAGGAGFGIPTCAVLPCGIDGVYPRSNGPLAAEILESGGLLLSEYPPGTTMHRYRFPERNRIIAGMAEACVVVEAPAVSGALITADHALDEGRDLWVAASRLGGQRSAGIDRLRDEGARALEDAGELVRELREGAARAIAAGCDGS
jgi:DNA processing protein